MNIRTLDAVDAVHICGGDHRTAAVIQALAEGHHVLCAPPMALNLDDCNRTLYAASEHGRILMVGHALRFRPAYRRLLDFITNGEGGRVRSATFIRHCGNPNDRSGGSLLNLLIDDIDQALLLFGVPSLVNCKAFAGPETAMGTLVYDGGPEVRIQGGWFPGPLPLTESFQVRADEAELGFSREGLLLNDVSGQRRKLDQPDGDDASVVLEYFVNCCRSGRQPVECPPSASALAVRIALLLKQSREMGGQPLECRL